MRFTAGFDAIAFIEKHHASRRIPEKRRAARCRVPAEVEKAYEFCKQALA